MARVLLATLLAFWCACVPAPSSAHARRRSLDARDALDHQNDFYLPRSVVPRSYRLQLVPRLDEGDFAGRVWINVTCLEPVDSITLHAHENLNTTSSRLSVRELPGDAASDDGREVAVSSTKKNFAKQWYIIVLGEKLKKGSDYELHVAFSGKLSDAASEAFFRGSYVDQRSQEKSWYAATAMETTKARQVFPCFDEPALKSTFQISVGARRRYHVWSNMPLKDALDMEERPGWLWHHFPTTPLMSTFSVGVLVSDFNYDTTLLPGGGYIRLSSRPELLENLGSINRLAAKAFDFAEEYLNFSYPLEKLDVIVLPKTSNDYFADSWGFVMIRESNIYDVEARTTSVAASVLTQWLGHLATPYWWSSIGIYSALVVHLTSQFKAQKLNMTAATMGYPLYHSNGGPKVQASAITGHEYTDRVIRLLRLLNYSLTENTFRQGLHIFLEDRQYKTFTEHNLWAALTVQGRADQTLEESVNIEDVAKSWLGKERYPMLTVTRNYEANTATVEQRVFLRDRPHDIPGKDRMLWYIPVMYISGDNMNVSDMRPVAWLKNQKHVTIEDLPGEDTFIIVNPDDIGSFMVNYDATNWALLSQALQEGALPKQTRAMILHNAWNLAYAGELDFPTALNITLFLKEEKTLEVWDRFFNMVHHLRRYLGGTEVEPMFNEYAKRLVDHCLRMLGPASEADDESTRDLRDAAQKIQKILSQQPPHSASLDQAYEAWMQSSDTFEYAKKNDVPFDDILRWGSLEQYQSVLEFALKLLDRGLDQDAKAMFATLARSAPQQAEKAASLLNALLLDDSPGVTSTNIARYCIYQLAGCYNGSVAVFHFVQENWDELRERLESKLELWKALMGAATARLVTQEDLDMFSEFYVEKRGHFGNAELLVEKELDRMKEDAVWTTDNIPVIHRWLEDFLMNPMFSVDS